MSSSMTRTWNALWWLPMIKGALAVVAGIVALVWPSPTQVVLIAVLAVYVIVDSIVTLLNARAVRGLPGGRALTAWGVIGLVVGIIMLARPGMTLTVVIVLVGVWVVLTGFALIAAAVPAFAFSRKAGLWLVVAGLPCVILGIAALVHPSFGVVALSLVIGLGALVYGGVHIGLAVVLRRLTHAVSRTVGSRRATVVEGEVVPEEGDDQDASGRRELE